MSELLTAAQMRAHEQAAIARGAVTGLELMERAGQGVVAAIFEMWPALAQTSHRAVVLCGPGNNGGDGFVVARLLRDWGWEVVVFLYGDPEKLPADARASYERWGGQVTVLSPDTGPLAGDYLRLEWPPDLVVDALFGIGLTRALMGMAATLCALFQEVRPPLAPKRVAIDMPSGLCADSGRALGPVFGADLTVSFHAPKRGHYLARGADLCGRTIVRDIGLPPAIAAERGQGDAVARLVGAPRVGLAKEGAGHKFRHGHALVLSGAPGATGAARLAARGALRVGAGLVSLASPAGAMAENAAQLTAIMLRPVDSGADLAAVLEDPRITALCMGPGMGLSDKSPERLAQGLQSGRAMVLDADALTLIGRERALFAMLHAGCVLTPHGGEFARLFPDLAARLDAPAAKGPAYSRIDATRDAARRAGCVVLLKGPDTVIAAPDGQCGVSAALYERAAPWLATAGSGDVLAGYICGLLARGFDAITAAKIGAWLHVECARRFGPGLIAEDLPEQLPAVFRELGL